MPCLFRVGCGINELRKTGKLEKGQGGEAFRFRGKIGPARVKLSKAKHFQTVPKRCLHCQCIGPTLIEDHFFLRDNTQKTGVAAFRRFRIPSRQRFTP